MSSDVDEPLLKEMCKHAASCVCNIKRGDRLPSSVGKAFTVQITKPKPRPRRDVIHQVLLFGKLSELQVMTK